MPTITKEVPRFKKHVREQMEEVAKELEAMADRFEYGKFLKMAEEIRAFANATDKVSEAVA